MLCDNPPLPGEEFTTEAAMSAIDTAVEVFSFGCERGGGGGGATRDDRLLCGDVRPGRPRKGWILSVNWKGFYFLIWSNKSRLSKWK